MAYPEDWTCPICGNKNKFSRNCKGCTYPRLWHCPKCEAENHDSVVCKKCGFNPVNPEKSKLVINKKYLIMGGLIVYTILMMGVAFYIITQDKVSFEGELVKGEEVIVKFWSFTQPDSVNFTLENDNIIISSTSSLNNSVWMSEGLTFNESGIWLLTVEKNYGNSVKYYTEDVKVNRECTLDSHCASKGEDYACNVQLGVCVEEEPSGLDFVNDLFGG